MKTHAAETAGFSLIELMTAVTIVGILSAIAIPAYNGYMQQARRSDAKAGLLQDAQYLERTFTMSNSYAAGVSLPVPVSPQTGTTAYNIAASVLTATAYTLTATPVAGGVMANDACGALSIDQYGAKYVSGTLSVSECWNK